MLLAIENLTIRYPSRFGDFTAVDDASLHLDRGEVLGIVGESGAGKSTIGNAIMGLLQAPGKMVGGSIIFDGQRLDLLSKKELISLRGKKSGNDFPRPNDFVEPPRNN